MRQIPMQTTPDIQNDHGEHAPASLPSEIISSYEEIALEGARLIDSFFPGSAESVLQWSPWNLPDETVLVYGDLFDSDDRKELFKTLLRHYFRLAGFRELSYVEYSGGGSDPIWVMLVKVHSAADLLVGVDLCRWASFGWPLHQYFRLRRYPKRRVDPMLKLMVPGYPSVDCTRPLNELMLNSPAESARTQLLPNHHTDDERYR